MPRPRIDYEARFRAALQRIARYDTTGALRRSAEKGGVLAYEELLEMAYENMRDEAVTALKGYRRPRRMS
jgi:hypothetical protein